MQVDMSFCDFLIFDTLQSQKTYFRWCDFYDRIARLDTRKYVYINIRLSRFSIRSRSHPNITTLVLDLERLCTCIYVRIRSIRSSRTDMLYCVWIWWWLRSLLRLRGDDHDLSYASTRQYTYIYVARLTTWTHRNWTKRSVVFASPKIDPDQHD